MVAVEKLVSRIKCDPFKERLLGSVAGALYLVAIISAAIEYAASLHWLIALSLILIAGCGLYKISLWIFTFTVNDSAILVFFFLGTSILLGAVVFAGFSFLMNGLGIASYTAIGDGSSLDTYRNFYLWVFFDMIPGINIWKTIPVLPPIVAEDVLSAVPVLFYKMFVMFFVFAGAHRWWKLHTDSNAHGNDDQGASTQVVK